MKRLIVSMLERLCTLTFHAGGHYCARKSDELDDRWGTGVWKPVER